jgi:hypothetical protein
MGVFVACVARGQYLQVGAFATHPPVPPVYFFTHVLARTFVLSPAGCLLRPCVCVWPPLTSQPRRLCWNVPCCPIPRFPPLSLVTPVSSCALQPKRGGGRGCVSRITAVRSGKSARPCFDHPTGVITATVHAVPRRNLCGHGRVLLCGLSRWFFLPHAGHDASVGVPPRLSLSHR